MPRTFLTLISLTLDQYLDDKFIEIWFPNAQAFCLKAQVWYLSWWADGGVAPRGLSTMDDIGLGQAHPGKSEWPTSTGSAQNWLPQPQCAGKNTVVLSDLALQAGSSFNHHLPNQNPQLFQFARKTQFREDLVTSLPEQPKHSVWRVYPPKPPCHQFLPAQAAAHNVLLFPATGNKGCCCRLMPAQLWHAPKWAAGAAGRRGHRETRGAYQPPVDVQGGFQAPGCWRALYSSCCSREVRLPAGTCGVPIPGDGMGGWTDSWAWLGSVA